tara:strand:- start:188 stop:2392 length:2205 start_codon:yes stop_codon:yes gene_type:complete
MARGQSPFQGRYTVPKVDFSPIERAGGAWGQTFAHLGQTVKQGVEARHELKSQLRGIKGQLDLLKTSPYAKMGGMESKIKELEGKLDSPDLSRRERVALGKSALQTIAMLANQGFQQKKFDAQMDISRRTLALRGREIQARRDEVAAANPPPFAFPPQPEAVDPTTPETTTPAPSSEEVAPLVEKPDAPTSTPTPSSADIAPLAEKPYYVDNVTGISYSEQEFHDGKPEADRLAKSPTPDEAAIAELSYEEQIEKKEFPPKEVQVLHSDGSTSYMLESEAAKIGYTKNDDMTHTGEGTVTLTGHKAPIGEKGEEGEEGLSDTGISERMHYMGGRIVDAPLANTSKIEEEVDRAISPLLVPPRPQGLDAREKQYLEYEEEIVLNGNKRQIEALDRIKEKRAAISSYHEQYNKYLKDRFDYHKAVTEFNYDQERLNMNHDQLAATAVNMQKAFAAKGVDADVTVGPDKRITVKFSKQEGDFEPVTINTPEGLRRMPGVYRKKGDPTNLYYYDETTKVFSKQGSITDPRDALLASRKSVVDAIETMEATPTGLTNWGQGENGGYGGAELSIMDYHQAKIAGRNSNGPEDTIFEHGFAHQIGSDEEGDEIWIGLSDLKTAEEFIAHGYYGEGSTAATQVEENIKKLEKDYSRYLELKAKLAKLDESLTTDDALSSSPRQPLFKVDIPVGGRLGTQQAGGAGGEQTTPPISDKLPRNEQDKIDPEVLEPVVEKIGIVGK